MKTIASIAVGQTSELLERLANMEIPAEIRTAPRTNGLELNEIVVEDKNYDRGCDVAEEWDREKHSKLDDKEDAAHKSSRNISKWPLFKAFCAGCLFFIALEEFQGHMLKAVIDLILASALWMNAARDQKVMPED